jgi:hypothetical protein
VARVDEQDVASFELREQLERNVLDLRLDQPADSVEARPERPARVGFDGDQLGLPAAVAAVGDDRGRRDQGRVAAADLDDPARREMPDERVVDVGVDRHVVAVDQVKPGPPRVGVDRKGGAELVERRCDHPAQQGQRGLLVELDADQVGRPAEERRRSLGIWDRQVAVMR